MPPGYDIRLDNIRRAGPYSEISRQARWLAIGSSEASQEARSQYRVACQLLELFRALHHTRRDRCVPGGVPF